MGRKIAIVGAGAVGGYAGAHMVQAGEDVTFIDPWPEHVEHMKKHGLRVTHAMDVPEFSVPVRALHVTDAQQLAKEKPVEGEVLAVGQGVRDETGRLIPLEVKVGDHVLFGKWAGTEVVIDGEERVILKQYEILGVIEGRGPKAAKAA